MSSPRRAVAAPRPRPLWKPVLALALAVVLGFTGYSTWAYWQDTADVSTGAFTSGSLDLQLDSNQAGGLGTAYSKTSITASALAPGESLAFPLSVRNAGSVPATYTATVQRGSGWTYPDGAITLRAFAGGTPDTSDTTFPRQQTCSGAGQTGAGVPVTTTATAVVPTARALPTTTAGEALCLLVAMPTGASNDAQAKTGTLVLTVTANQVVQ